MCNLRVVLRLLLYRSWQGMGRLYGVDRLARALGGGVEGTLCGVCVPIAGIRGSECGGHVASRGEVVNPG